MLDPAFILRFLYPRYPVFIIDAFYTLEQYLLLCILLTVEEQENSENELSTASLGMLRVGGIFLP